MRFIHVEIPSAMRSAVWSTPVARSLPPRIARVGQGPLLVEHVVVATTLVLLDEIFGLVFAILTMSEHHLAMRQARIAFRVDLHISRTQM